MSHPQPLLPQTWRFSPQPLLTLSDPGVQAPDSLPHWYSVTQNPSATVPLSMQTTRRPSTNRPGGPLVQGSWMSLLPSEDHTSAPLMLLRGFGLHYLWALTHPEGHLPPGRQGPALSGPSQPTAQLLPLLPERWAQRSCVCWAPEGRGQQCVSVCTRVCVCPGVAVLELRLEPGPALLTSGSGRAGVKAYILAKEET